LLLTAAIHVTSLSLTNQLEIVRFHRFVTGKLFNFHVQVLWQ
jgi:hypothetical protein